LECGGVAKEFSIEYVELPNGRVPVREFLDSLDEAAAAKVVAFIERLRVYGLTMPAKYVKKLGGDLFELRVKHFDRIFRVVYFYQPGMLIVAASGFQKKAQETPPAEIARAQRLRALWLKYRNRYPELESVREKILREAGL
jgi:phage-related protein